MKNNIKMVVVMTSNKLITKKDEVCLADYEKKIAGTTLFEWSLETLNKFFDNEFIFMVQKDLYNLEKIEAILSDKINNYAILELDQSVSEPGQVALAADSLLSDDDQVIIMEIGTDTLNLELNENEILDSENACVLVSDRREKFGKLKPPTKNRNITKQNSKQFNFEREITGIYYLSNWKLYTDIYSKYAKVIKGYNRELTIPALIKYMVKEDYNINIISTPISTISQMVNKKK